MLTGENGILTQAGNAKEQTQKAEAEEIFKLIEIESQMGTNIEQIIESYNLDEIKDNNDGSFTIKHKGYEAIVTQNGDVGEIAVVGEKVKESNKYYSKNGVAKIPVGFAIVPGCDDVSEGLVISDVENDLNDEGNQFVWIPVTDENKYVRNTSYDNKDVSEKAIDDTDYLPEGITNEKQAVLDAGGFYIGRYEAGDSTANDFRTSATEGTLVCQKDKYPYTQIRQDKAKPKAKTFIPTENTAHVKSALISGIQWDVTMETINGRLDGNGQIYDVTKSSKEEPSIRHTGSPAKTGQNIADKVYNIYDLEGNFLEYIAEKNTYASIGPCVYRGGEYSPSGNPPSASYRFFKNGGAYDKFSFRLALYVM